MGVSTRRQSQSLIGGVALMLGLGCQSSKHVEQEARAELASSMAGSSPGTKAGQDAAGRKTGDAKKGIGSEGVARACKQEELRLHRTAEDAAMGHRAVVVSVQNQGPSTCTVHGYPEIALLGPNGKVLPQILAEERSQSYLTGARRIRTVTLGRGGLANFEVVFSVQEIGKANAPCPTAAGFRFALPNSTKAVGHVTVQVRACGSQVGVLPWYTP